MNNMAVLDTGFLISLVDRNRPRLQALCRQRGLSLDDLTEQEREALIDQILHEA